MKVDTAETTDSISPHRTAIYHYILEIIREPAEAEELRAEAVECLRIDSPSRSEDFPEFRFLTPQRRILSARDFVSVPGGPGH